MSETFKKIWQEEEKELMEKGVFNRAGEFDIVKHITKKEYITGFKQGFQESRKKERKKLILNMLKKKLDIKLVSRVTGLSAKEIKKLKNGA